MEEQNEMYNIKRKLKKSTIDIITFALFTFVTYAILHYYVIYQITDLFATVNEKYLAAILMFFLFVIYPLSSVLHKFFENKFVDVLYTIGSIWLGTIIIATFVFLCSDFTLFVIENLGIYIRHSIVGTFDVFLIVAAVIYALKNSRKIYVRKVTLSLPNLPRKLWGFKIIHISDVHVGIVYDEEFLEKIVMKANKLEPDLVAITGDLFDGTGKLTKTLVEPIKYFNAPYGVFYVTGNHENYTGEVEKIKEYLKYLNVNVLEREVVDLDGLQIAGIDAPKNELLPNKKAFEELGRKVDRRKSLVLLYHFPNSTKLARNIGVNLQLSGHTHSGQLFPYTIISRIMYPHNFGVYYIKGMFLNVSSGVGTWGPRMRLLSRNEIVQITLFPETMRRRK